MTYNRFILSRFWRLEVQNQRVVRVDYFHRCWGRAACLSAGWWRWPADPGILCFANTSSCFLLYFTWHHPLVCPFFPLLIRSPSLDLGFTLIRYDLIFKKIITSAMTVFPNKVTSWSFRHTWAGEEEGSVQPTGAIMSESSLAATVTEMLLLVETLWPQLNLWKVLDL